MEKSICIFGDSITWGSSDWEGGGWAHKIQHYVNSFDEDRWQRVFVLGVPGDRTRDLLARFKVEAEARKPNTIIIAIGINNTYSKEPGGSLEIPVEQFREEIEELANLAKTQADDVVFVGLLKVDENRTMPRSTRPVYCANKTVNEFNQIIKETCDKNGLQFLSMSGVLETSDLDDGLHPNTTGHEKIFQIVKNFLREQKLI